MMGCIFIQILNLIHITCFIDIIVTIIVYISREMRCGNMISEIDKVHLKRCIELAEEALRNGDAPFDSVLVSGEGEILFENRNRISGGDNTRHPAVIRTERFLCSAISYTGGLFSDAWRKRNLIRRNSECSRNSGEKKNFSSC